MARRIKNASEITDAKKSYIMEFPEEKQPQKQTKHHRKRKKHDMRLGKITKKDISENSNKRKKKQNSFLPPDVAAMQADVEFIKQQIAQEAIEQKNIEKFGTKDPLHPDKLGMINYVFTQKETRDFDELLESLKTKPVINKSRQSEINKIYKQMKKKNINNDISQRSKQTINQQLEANKKASRNKLPKKNIDNNISRNSTKTINAQKAEEKGV